MFDGLSKAIDEYPNYVGELHTFHPELKKIYDWEKVGRKTVNI